MPLLPSLILPPRGSGIRNIEAVSLAMSSAEKTDTITLSTPIKEGELLLITPSFEIVSSDHAGFPFIKPQTVVDGKFTEILAERNHTKISAITIETFAVELLGAKSIEYYSGTKASGTDLDVTIASVVTAKSIIIPLGFSNTGVLSGFGDFLLEFKNATTVTVKSGVGGDYSFAVLETY